MLTNIYPFITVIYNCNGELVRTVSLVVHLSGLLFDFKATEVAGPTTRSFSHICNVKCVDANKGGPFRAAREETAVRLRLNKFWDAACKFIRMITVQLYCFFPVSPHKDRNN